MKKVLITGAGGLIGSEAVLYFAKRGYDVVGLENNMRQYFFGAAGSVLPTIERLKDTCLSFRHIDVDIRDEFGLQHLFEEERFDYILHTAAQPSHDWAAKEPHTDFSVNAIGTLNLLEAARQHSKHSPFIFMSTNKVYGDRPNELPFVELDTRFDLPEGHPLYAGVDETMSIDQSKHSLFGVSKAAADLLVQEYGRYFNMPTCVFRGGCLTGSQHAGVELHGFLSYLVKCIVHEKPYTVFGYQGKQVRDNINACDVVTACHAFFETPRVAAVYNIGGSRFSHLSVNEAISKIEAVSGKTARVTYVDEPRIGDHQWYVSDVRKFQTDYPEWEYTVGVDAILEAICAAELKKT